VIKMLDKIVGLGATRDELRQMPGEPDDVSIERKHGQPVIWKYGEIEYHFAEDSRVCLIYTEDCKGNGRTIAKSY
jgi:hypothetical protein